MSKREEIREGVAERIIVNDLWKLKDLPAEKKAHYLGKADTILQYLHSQDVVIKVDRELPPFISNEIYSKREMAIAVEQAGLMLKAGYAAVEPLIEEV